MPNQSDPLKNSKTGEFELPSELSEIENRLRDLQPSISSSLDRDDLMFQSGYAAAMAAAQPAPVERNSAAHWGWPVLSGTFATIAAALAVALWISPISGGDTQQASQPEQSVTLQLVDTEQPETTVDENSNPSFVASNPVEQVITPYLGNLFGGNSSPSSAYAMRNHLLRGIEMERVRRPHIDIISVEPQRAPLKVNSYRNQELWEQL